MTVKQQQFQMRENQAKFWHAFAFLAVHGKRDWQSYSIAMLTDPPGPEQVAAIVAEAADFKQAS